MPVLMNKGDNPRQAAWLFYTDLATLESIADAAYEGRYDAGSLVVDAADLDGAKKASAEVPVYLEVQTLVPEDFDLTQIEEALIAAGKAALESAATSEDEAAENTEGSPANEDAETNGADDPARPYEPLPAPKGLRIAVGKTTAAAARSYIAPRESTGDAPWDAKLPGLQMLVSLLRHMREHGGLPPFAVWHIDVQGILRMAPAKTLKPMAGNILKCKL